VPVGRASAAAIALLIAASAAPAAASARAYTPVPRSAAHFRVGADTDSIDPQLPVYSGGFGLSPPIRRVADRLSTRALYVSNGRHAVAFAVVDAQGYFAATQLKGDDGIQEIRDEAARRTGMKASDIVVQATHTHAGPTLEGIWGPVPDAYLARVRKRTVAAIVSAARHAVPARLQWGTVDAPYLDNIATAQTDSYPGWAQDGQISVLRAVRPRDGSTIATFANVPAHGDIVNGAHDKQLSADYFGAVDTALQRGLGGAAIVSPATLGREETPVQATSLANMHWFAGSARELVLRALARARWVTDPTVRSTERMQQIPGTNPALLALVAAWHLPPAQRQQEADQSGIYPIDRADTPPWLTGNTIATPLTALRIGGLVFLSMPGEPFPEVRHSIRNGAPKPKLIVALSKGQDDLGYFYPSFDYFFTFAYPSDHGTYNVAPQMGEQVIESQLANIAALGYSTSPTAPKPDSAKYDQGLRPGLQALASPARGAVGRDGRFRTTLQAIYAPAAFGGKPMAGKVHWGFGDGTSADTRAATFGDEGKNAPRFVHAFPRGTHTVKLTAHDSDGNAATWKLQVVAYPRLRPRIQQVSHTGHRWKLRAQVRGGDGRVLAYRWRFADGRHARGRVVTHRFGGRPRATLVVTDATGSQATARTR
jgi:hypothetical protein